MKIVRPIAVTDAVLAASNVPETEHAAWAGGTTYAAGARVLRISTDIHRVYESVVSSNVGNDPLADDGSKWLLIGADNTWSMFDGVVQSQTTHADSVEVTLDVPGRIDTVALLNVSATSAQVTVTDAIEGVVYDETRALVSPSGITDWYAYFFEPIERLTDIVFEGLPPYANPTVDVVLEGAGETVACGALIAGLSKDLGGTQYGASLGIIDYSVKTKNDFGEYSIVERAFSRKASFAVFVENTLVDQVMRLLSDYRATPILYLGSTRFAASAVYGFYRDFSAVISFPDVSVLSIELEGLT